MLRQYGNKIINIKILFVFLVCRHILLSVNTHILVTDVNPSSASCQNY